MTPAQHKTLQFLAAYIQANGYSPSYDEIADHLGIGSKSGVNRLVCALEDLGKIKRLRDRARSIEVLAPVAIRATAPTVDDLVKRLTDDHGFDDGEGVMIVCTPEEARHSLAMALAGG